MIEDWTINCGYFEWPACHAYFDIATPEEDWRTELHVEFDVIDYGKGNPLADNPNDYYGGYDYEWYILDEKVLKESFSVLDQYLIRCHIDESIGVEIEKRRKEL